MVKCVTVACSLAWPQLCKGVRARGRSDGNVVRQGWTGWGGGLRRAEVTVVKGATPGPRKQTSAGQGLTNISVTTENGESWEGRCAGVSVTKDGLTHRLAKGNLMRRCRKLL